ncbi:nitroreductase family protein [bacterium]|nr:nitroreductase family protein [bacterium]
MTSDEFENNRVLEAEVDPMFPGRWSPRAFLSDPIPETLLMSLFEAARWSPSCFNEQPWVFHYANEEMDKKRFLEALVEGNQKWAYKAPVLVFILARRHFKHNNTENRYAMFDAGAAWMALALQARKHGLYTHAMAGFDDNKAYEILNVSKESHMILAAIAIGRRGDPNDLSEDYRAIESPNIRKPLSEMVVKG